MYRDVPLHRLDDEVRRTRRRRVGWSIGLPSGLIGLIGLTALTALGGAAAARAEGDIRLREVSADWGLVFRHHHGGSGKRYMPESVVGGVVIFDYDGDGDPDVFFVDGAALPGYTGEPPRSRLFRNDGGGRFVDVTDASGIEVDSYGAGGAAGDVDGDGDLDLYVTAFGPNRLFRNEGDGTFTEVGAAAGVDDPAWSESTTFFDADRDGDLDLYVVNYVDFTIATHKFCGDPENGIQGYCHPDAYDGVPDRFYRNRGDGTFEDATAEAGLAVEGRAGLGVAAGDLDDDGWPDLYVANDAEPNYQFLNRGDGTFEEVALLSGTATNDRGGSEGSMGVALGDVDGDGGLDIMVTNFEFESDALYKNAGSGIFVDGRYTTKVAEPSLPMLAFGIVLVDLDQDGDLDAAIGDGHILDNAEVFNPMSRHAQPNRVLENLGGGRFEQLTGTGFEEPVKVTRAVAAGDLDGDGDPDLVVVNANDLASVYENLSPGADDGWLQVDLRGSRSNRFGVGTRLELEDRKGDGDEKVQVREVETGSSYLAQSSITAHFGLGSSGGDGRVDGLRVRWPSGARQEIEDLPPNRRLMLYETAPRGASGPIGSSR